MPATEADDTTTPIPDWEQGVAEINQNNSNGSSLNKPSEVEPATIPEGALANANTTDPTAEGATNILDSETTTQSDDTTSTNGIPSHTDTTPTIPDIASNNDNNTTTTNTFADNNTTTDNATTTHYSPVVDAAHANDTIGDVSVTNTNTQTPITDTDTTTTDTSNPNPTVLSDKQ